MEVSDLKTLVASYFQKSTSEFGTGAEDKLLFALNNAQRSAQRRVDFEVLRTTVDLTVDLASGADLSSALLHGTQTSVAVKKVLAAFAPYNDGSFRPVRFIGRDSQIARSLRRFKDTEYNPNISNPIMETPGNRVVVVQTGTRINLYPTSGVFSSGSVGIALDVISWLPDLEDDSDEDDSFLLDKGTDYLFWKAIVEVNHRFKEFVPRTEGNLGPPDKLAEAAFEELLVWNSGLIYTGDDSNDME